MWKYFPDISSYITENFASINTVILKNEIKTRFSTNR